MEGRMAETTTAALDFTAAKEHFDMVLLQYLDLLLTPNVITAPALKITFAPLLKRYVNGERSQELYDEMWGVE
jgi:hypothetical protein